MNIYTVYFILGFYKKSSTMTSNIIIPLFTFKIDGENVFIETIEKYKGETIGYTMRFTNALHPVDLVYKGVQIGMAMAVMLQESKEITKPTAISKL
jgi:hypothetical protein